MSRMLIASMSYVATKERRDLTILWSKLIDRLNPDTDVFLVDSSSPISPVEFLGWGDYPIRPRKSIFRFGENIGHLNQGGGNGAGRAFAKCLEVAIEEKYDHVAIIESDLLFARPVSQVIERMERTGVKAAAPMDFMYHFIESGLVFLNVQYIKDTNLVERYAWDKPLTIFPEVHLEKLLGDDLWILPFRGLRNDGNKIDWRNWDRSFPYGVDYFTHSADVGLYDRFLRQNGIKL